MGASPTRFRVAVNILAVIFPFFIFAGLRLDAKRRRKVTPTVWLPLLWMFICSSRSVGQWLNLSSPTTAADHYSEAALGGSLADQIVLSLLIAWGCVIIYKRQEILDVLRNNRLLIAFIVYLGITALWSDIGGASLRKWVRLVGGFVMAAVLVTEPEPLEALESLFRRAACLLIPLSVMLIKYFPQLGVIYTKGGETLWVGVAVYKNGLAQLVLVMTFFLGWEAVTAWSKRREITVAVVSYNTILLLMCLWLLNGPGRQYSASAVGTLIFGVAIVIISRARFVEKNFQRIGAAAIFAICVFVLLEFSVGVTEFVVAALGRDMTFTDRVPLWRDLVDWGLKKPFLGYGYESFWVGERLVLIEGFQEAHNGFLEIFLGGGMVAMVLLAAVLMAVVNDIQRSALYYYHLAVLRLALLAIILVANITESCLASQRDLLSFVFFIVALSNQRWR